MSIRGSVSLIPQAPVRHIVELAVEAERLGFSRCWVTDEGLGARDVYVTLAAIATRTRTIGFGTGVTNPYTRHPAVTATTIATLSEMSNGRAFLGLGAGGHQTLDPMGIVRRWPESSLRETIVACRQLFAGTRVNTEGRFVTLHDAELGFGDPEIEIWLASGGPRNLAVGGELASGVLIDSVPLEALGDCYAHVSHGASKSGNEPTRALSILVATSAAELDAIRPHMTYRLLDCRPELLARMDISPQDLAPMRSAMTQGLHAASEFVREEWIEHFVILGTVSDCAFRLARLAEMHDLSEFVFPVLELHQAIEAMQVLANVVAKI